MRQYFIICLILPMFLFGYVTDTFSREINGELAEFENGVRVLRLWGTNYEMGYAHGYLLGPEVLHMMEVYAFPPPDTGTWLYDLARSFVMNNFEYPLDFREEAQGVLDGMIASGVEAFVPVLGRNLEVEDIMTFTSLPEVAGLLCTTVIGWGAATSSVPEIEGTLIAAHNTDHVIEPDEAFYIGEKGILFVYHPSGEDKQPFISVTYPGFMGLVAGVNASGIGLLMNRGLYEVPPSEWDLDPKMAPGTWYAREALALRDIDSDGAENILDIMAFYDDVRVFTPFLVQVFGPVDGNDPPTVTMEINNATRTVRYPEEDPIFSPDIMLTLNWEDKLLPERTGRPEMRYQSSNYYINIMYQRVLSEQNLWHFLRQMSGQDPFSITAHSTLFLPDKRKLALSLWSDFENTPATNHAWFDFDELFMYLPTDDDDDDVNDDADDDADDDSDDDEVNDDASDDDSDAVENPDEDGDGISDAGCGC
jgi:hypothetical protein